jgi:hypothetical protein
MAGGHEIVVSCAYRALMVAELDLNLELLAVLTPAVWLLDHKG